MKNTFWTGPRESDIAYTDNLFSGSGTIYGSNIGNNRSFCAEKLTRINHNNTNLEASDFILRWQQAHIKENPDCRFMSYNPNCVFGAPEDVISRTICINDAGTMDQLNNKLKTRRLLENIVPMLPASCFAGGDCRLSVLLRNKQFEHAIGLIIQQTVSSGGQGTFLLTKETEEEIVGQLHSDEEYIVTEYVKNNIPVNLHAIIFPEAIQLFPGSIQIIQEGENRLLYRGADFITYQKICVEQRQLLDQYAFEVCRELQGIGYRGVVGLDFIITSDNCYFLEVNNRFQGSSILVNRALRENGLPSLQKQNYEAFYGEQPNRVEMEQIHRMTIPYSLFTFVNEMGGVHSARMYQALCTEKRVIQRISEGYRQEQEAEDYASQFAAIFSCNLLSLCPGECGVRLHQNLVPLSAAWRDRILAGDLNALKIAIINQGAILTESAKKFIEVHGGMRIGTYYSLDLLVRGTYMNCPLYAKFVTLSPFDIDYNEEKNSLCLKYYGHLLHTVEYDKKTVLPKEYLQSGVHLDQICFLATDRLRLQNNSYCTYPKHGLACKFCEANGIHNSFQTSDIMEAIDVMFVSQPLPFRHILIGGLSNEIGKEKNVILEMCRRIRSYSDMPIYLMCLPPKQADIAEYYAAGVTEFGFNMEVYDHVLAKKYMPGKGFIPRDCYLDSLKNAVMLAGKQGAVRCAFIAGLEPMESILQGIESVCRIGAAPILSVFRPIYGTEMEEVIPPNNEWLYTLMERAEFICNKYNLSLGPECTACRNNTLTFV